MNGVAGFIGWLVIWCVVAVVVCVPVGKFIAYRTRADRPRSSRDEFSPLRPVPSLRIRRGTYSRSGSRLTTISEIPAVSEPPL